MVKLPVEGEANTYFLAWTTTPWTLISNLALSVGSDIDYAMVEKEGEKFILATAAIGSWFEQDVTVLKTFKGKAQALGKPSRGQRT